MTSGVPFHYVGNVKAQLSQWLYPWCKGNSVISFFPPLFLSLSSRSPPPFFLLSTMEIFIGTANRVLFVSEVRAARPLVTSHFGGWQMMERKLETFYLEIVFSARWGNEVFDIFQHRLSTACYQIVEGIVVSRCDFFAKNFLFGTRT